MRPLKARRSRHRLILPRIRSLAVECGGQIYSPEAGDAVIVPARGARITFLRCPLSGVLEAEIFEFDHRTLERLPGSTGDDGQVISRVAKPGAFPVNNRDAPFGAKIPEQVLREQIAVVLRVVDLWRDLKHPGRVVERITLVSFARAFAPMIAGLTVESPDSDGTLAPPPPSGGPAAKAGAEKAP